MIQAAEGKIIRQKTKKDNKKPDVLQEGLMICLDKLSKMRYPEMIEEYLSGNDDSESTMKEEIARLLLVATTLPTSISPTIDISEKLIENHVTDINSMFIKEFLELEARSKTTSFMKSDFYKKIRERVEVMEERFEVDGKYSLNDSIVLLKNIRNLYIANLDQNIDRNTIDFRSKEPLLELFQHNLDLTHEKIKNGVKDYVQLQTRHQ